MSFLDTLIYGYRTLYNAGVEITRRNKLNFVSGITGVDNPITGMTDVTADGGGNATTTNGDATQEASEVDTNNATPTTIGTTFALETDKINVVDVQVEAIHPGASKAKIFNIRRSLLNDGGTIVAPAQQDLVTPEEIGGTSAASVAIAYTGTTGRVEVTGLAATDMRWRADRQIVKLLARAFSGSAPTVSSISPDLADPAGGSSHVITGTSFTGASAVTIGGTAVTSYVVDSDTQITATIAARAAGASLSVDVTNPAGTNGANTLFEYWAPESLPLTLFFDKEKSAYTVATWNGIASAGSSGGRNATQTTPTNQPAAASGEPDFDGVDNWLVGTATMADLFNADTGTILFVWDDDTQDAPNASFLDPGIFTDAASYIGVFVNTSGIGAYVLDTGGTRKATTEAAAATGTRRVGMARWNGTNLTLSLGASIDAASVACGNVHGDGLLAGNFFQLGTNYSNAAFLDGRIRAVATLDSTLDNGSYTKFRKWAQASRGAA